MPTILETYEFVEKLFDGVKDKGGVSYCNHCIRVATYFTDDETVSIDGHHAALLHDVLEDTDVTAEQLLEMGYSKRTVELVQALSRPKGMTYMDWIRQIAASGDKELIQIKLADNKDNSDPKRIKQLPEEERDILKRYQRAKKILEEGLKN